MNAAVGGTSAVSSQDERENPLAHLQVVTDLSECVLPLLAALQWCGAPREVAEAVPHFIEDLDITSFQNIFANLGYRSQLMRLPLAEVDPRLLPCLYLPDQGDALVVERWDGPSGRVEVFDGGSGQHRSLDPAGVLGEAGFFQEVDPSGTSGKKRNDSRWVHEIGMRFRVLVAHALGLTLILNLLALVIPMFVMGVYDRVVATGSMSTLWYFGLGVVIAIAGDAVLRRLRAQKMAFIGARFDTIVGKAIFSKILSLPPSFSEGASTGSQVARIKDFETIREFFTGPMALVLVELPFVVIYLWVIARLAGPVALVPLGMLVLFAVSGWVLSPVIKRLGVEASVAGTLAQEFLLESLSNMRALKYTASETTWIRRYRELAAQAAITSFRASWVSGLNRALASLFMQVAGLGTIAFGVLQVLDQSMTIGGLVACMILVWRVLSPLQTGFISLSQVSQVRASIEQINNLMKIPSERHSQLRLHQGQRMRGEITFARVSLRYSPDADPALLGVSFQVKPGEVVGIIGPNGSGKSTIIKILVGMVTPQAGSVLVDNMDIRQRDPFELRRQIGYVPQIPQFFYGTIAQNLRLAHPVATDLALRAAASRAGCLEEIESLEQGSGRWRRTGFEYRIGDAGSNQLPASLLQRISLARAYLKEAPILLFDEPGSSLDFAGDQVFMQAIREFKGSTTCLLVTYRPSHLRLADKILLLDHGGRVKAFGPSADVIKLL